MINSTTIHGQKFQEEIKSDQPLGNGGLQILGNRKEVDEAISREMELIENNPNLTQEEKEKLKRKLRWAREDLDDADSADEYNRAVDELQEVVEKRKRLASDGSSAGMSGSSGGNATGSERSDAGSPLGAAAVIEDVKKRVSRAAKEATPEEMAAENRSAGSYETGSSSEKGASKPGTVQVDGTSVYEGNVDEFKELKQDLKDLRAKRRSIKNNPNLSQSKKEELLDQVDAAIRQVKRGLDFATDSAQYDTTSGSRIDDANQSAINQAIASANDTMRDVNMRLDMATRGTSRPNRKAGAPGCHGAHGASGASATGGAERTGRTGGSTGTAEAGGPSSASGAGGASSAGSSSGSVGLGGAKIPGMGMTVSDALEQMANNPQEFFKKLNDLSPKDRMRAMQMIQQQMQQIQRMSKMMSQLSKSMHQAKMGIIRNM